MMAPSLLVVDDSPEVGTLVRILGRRAGWTVRLAGTAEIGLELLRDAPTFDLVLIDQNLPGMSGLELFQRVPPAVRCPLSMFLQSSLVEDLARAVRVGVRQVVYKDTLSEPQLWKDRCQEIIDAASGNFPDWLLEVSSQPFESLDGTSEKQLLPFVERGLGGERGRLLTPALFDGLRKDAAERFGERMPLVVEALFYCWRLLGTSEIQGLRTTLEPFLAGISTSGSTV